MANRSIGPASLLFILGALHLVPTLAGAAFLPRHPALAREMDDSFSRRA